ncbi:curli production assembly/transport component CsgF [Carboxylicivirga sp. M1479]|uniref:curli production assembly/transport component CsgF n=1 Tax=Carboxylicivirga sp. M1479 TaxID=2594476 RepID=UPI0011786345|nr:curli production assembly/transport component CsgF [Carboxylicivirga sp. M1479]TRX66457.1 curli production assembly/transport component CsgF [Carboxylicivirga sp. M1479]
MKLLVLVGLGLLFGMTAYSQDFVYKPINPAFGGDTYNYSWLLSQAQAQDTFKDPDAITNDDPLASFQEDLNRQILYQLSRKLVQDQFGDGDLQPGVYDVGDYHIQVGEGAEGVNVSILDVVNGGQTSVTVPNN